MSQFSVPDVIQIGDISSYLAANDEATGNLFGEKLSTPSAMSIAIVSDALRWQWQAFPDVLEVRAVGSINIISGADAGQSISVYINDPYFGNIVMGYQVTFANATSANDVASQLCIACNTNSYGYVFANSSPSSLITITAPPNYGSIINGGNRITVQII